MIRQILASRFKVLTLAIGIALANEGYAKQEEAHDASLLSMSLAQLLDIEVTGPTRDEQTFRLAPAAISVFTHTEIAAMGLSTLDQLVNFAPGYQSNRNGGSPIYAPYTSRARRISGSSSEILLLVDGQRINDPRTSGASTIVPQFPLANIERIEFIRGPGSALYGSNAMQGVINIVTLSNQNRASLEVGSFDHTALNFFNSQQVANIQIDSFLDIQQDGGDNYNIPSSASPDGTVATQDPKSRLSLNIKAQKNNTQLKLQHYTAEAEDFYLNGGIANGVNKHKSELSALELVQTFRLDNSSSMLSANYTRSSTLRIQQLLPAGSMRDMSTPSSDAPFTGGTKDNVYSEYELQWTNNWQINSANKLQFGASYRHIDSPELQVTTNYDIKAFIAREFPITYYGKQTDGPPAQHASTRDILGVYLQHQTTVADKLHITLGARHDEFSNIGNRLSPRLALVYTPTDANTFKYLYAEAYRAPSEAELNLTDNPQFLGNPNLQPEVVTTSEIIWIFQCDKYSLTSGIFEHQFTNAIVQQSIGERTQQNFNMDQSPVRGAELELALQVTPKLFVRANTTAIWDKPETSYREASRLASLMVSYQHQQWNANVGAYWHGETEMATNGDDSQRTQVDAFTLATAKVSRAINSQLNVYLKAYNVFDSDIATAPESSSLQQGIPNRGRNIQLGFTYHF